MPFLTTTGGLNFSYPTDGTTNWGSTLKTSFNTISGHNHTGAPNGVQLGTNSLQNNAITEAKFRLTNNSFLRARNAADSADLGTIKITTSDEVQLGNGTSSVLVSGANITLSGSGTIGSSGPFVFPAGTASAPSVTFTGDTNTGFYNIAADTIGAATNGVERVRIDTAAVTSTLPYVAPAGSVSAPSLTFASDLNTGFYQIAADTIGATTNGVERVRVDTAAVTSTLPIVHPAGTVGAPSLTFASDTNTGFYQIAADTIGAATNGVERVRVDTAAVTSTLPVVHPIGSASAPSLTFASDTNTGVFSPTADTLGFSAGGTERARITSTGQLQVTSTSGNPCSVTSSTNSIVSSVSTNGYASFSRNASTGNTCYDFYQVNNVEVARITADSSSNFTISTGSSATGRMTINSSGDVGIGTSSTGGYRIAVVGSAASSKTMYLHTDATASYVYSLDAVNIGSTGAANLNFVTNNSVRATVHSTGAFSCTGIYSYVVGATNRDTYIDNNGFLGYVSSIRASKTEIQPLTDFSWLYDLEPVTFKYRKRDSEGNYTEETDGDIQYGMIAEDVEPIRPDLCFYDVIDGQQELRGIQYSKLTAVMLKAIQDLNTRISALEAQVTPQ